MSAATMLEKLKEEFPGREYMLPFESAIKNYISFSKTGMAAQAQVEDVGLILFYPMM